MPKVRPKVQMPGIDGVEVRILSYPQMGLVSAPNRALSKYSSAKEKQIMEIATIRS